MGIFEAVFGQWKKKQITGTYFGTLNGYSPAYTTYDGGLYEMDLTRAAIHSKATFCSKLKPEMMGKAKKHLEPILQLKPNPFMDTTKFLYRLCTILEINNTAFIVPIEDDSGAICGYYPILPQSAEVVDVSGRPYMRYKFANGKQAAIEFDRVGIMTKFAYGDDFFGSTNDAMRPTLQLMHTQKQGIINAIKTSALVRYIARVGTMLDDEDIARKREAFADSNLNPENNKSGLMIADQTFTDIKQVENRQYTVDAAQMELIQGNVFQYFGTNKAILQNEYNEDQWNAFYEGSIEPFAIQLSQVMTAMTYTRREIGTGNQILFSSNRLQYANNRTKIALTYQLLNCGVLTRNEAREVLNLPKVTDGTGDKFFMRRDYALVDEIGKTGNGTDESMGGKVKGTTIKLEEVTDDEEQ